jgi:hypothetical protein
VATELATDCGAGADTSTFGTWAEQDSTSAGTAEVTIG